MFYSTGKKSEKKFCFQVCEREIEIDREREILEKKLRFLYITTLLRYGPMRFGWLKSLFQDQKCIITASTLMIIPNYVINECHADAWPHIFLYKTFVSLTIMYMYINLDRTYRHIRKKWLMFNENIRHVSRDLVLSCYRMQWTKSVSSSSNSFASHRKRSYY